VFALGALLVQAALLGPSLTGRKVLLPADLLAAPNVYLPLTDAANRVEPQNTLVSDVVFTLALHGELARRQLREGRWPLWNPYSYCGAPLLGGAQAQALSPFSWIQLASPLEFPRNRPWAAALRALFGALGAFAFFRNVLRARFWPAAIGGWIWPLGGFATMWAGFPHSEVVLELPWLVVAVAACLRRPRGLGLVGLAAITALMLVGGHPATAATAMIGAAVLGAWLWFERYRTRPVSRDALLALATIATGIVLGVALSAPQTLTTLEYLPLTLRATARAGGHVDIPPVGWAAAPLFALPYAQGSNLASSAWLLQGNHIESAAGGYMGLLTLLVLAPLAFARRGRWARPIAIALIGLVCAGQALALPGVVQLCEAWPLRVLQNNRSVFVTGFCSLSLAVIGLDRAWRGRIDRRAPLFVAVSLLLALGAWSWMRADAAPETLANWLALTRQKNPARADAVAATFASLSARGALFAGVAALLALLIAWGGARRRSITLGVAALAVLELVSFQREQVTQCEPQLAYPPIPALDALRELDSSARIVGINCLPAALNLSHELRGIRGYDGLDPTRIVELLDLFRNPKSPRFEYAATQWFTPTDSPLLDLMGVRFLVQRGKPRGADPVVAESPGYYVVENDGWLPRAYIPRRLESVAEGDATLARLASPEFDPREVAFAPPGSPELADGAQGVARITLDEPDRVRIETQSDQRALLVLTDAWYPGWNAYRGDERLDVLRVDHAFRGVVVDAGASTIEFRYEPASFANGLRIAGLALAALAMWSAWTLIGRRRLVEAQR